MIPVFVNVDRAEIYRHDIELMNLTLSGGYPYVFSNRLKDDGSNFSNKEEIKQHVVAYYKRMMDIAKNPVHKDYAEKMYESMINGTQKKVFNNEPSYKFISKDGIRFKTLKQGAEILGIPENHFKAKYYLYGVKKIKR